MKQQNIGNAYTYERDNPVFCIEHANNLIAVYDNGNLEIEIQQELRQNYPQLEFLIPTQTVLALDHFKIPPGTPITIRVGERWSNNPMEVGEFISPEYISSLPNPTVESFKFIEDRFYIHTKYENNFKMIMALFHELTHLNQCIQGKLRQTNDCVIWNGIPNSHDEIRRSTKLDDSSYNKYPWEKEANIVAWKLTRAFIGMSGGKIPQELYEARLNYYMDPTSIKSQIFRQSEEFDRWSW